MEDAAIVDAMERRFAARGWKMPAVNRRQAQVPRGAIVLANPNGTAPGLWIEHGDRADRAAAGPAARDEADDGRRSAPAAGRASPATCVCIAGWFASSGKGESLGRGDRAADLLAVARAVAAIETTILAGLGQVELHLVTQSDDAAAAARAWTAR